MASAWHIELLGRFQAVRKPETVTRFRTQKTAALLAYLACHIGEPQSREVLAGLLWPEHDPDSARGSLRTALSSLRVQLEQSPSLPGSILTTTRRHAYLRPGSATSDVQEFQNALRDARRAGGAERLRRLGDAVDLYHGPLLPGFYEEWVLELREVFARQVEGALNELVQEYERLGDQAAAVPYAQQLVRLDSTREEAHTLLMRLLIRSGQPAAAVAQFEELSRTLAQHLEEEPGPHARALLVEARRALHSLAVPRDPELLPRSQPVTRQERRTLTCVLGESTGGPLAVPPDLLSECEGRILRQEQSSVRLLFPSASSAVRFALQLWSTDPGGFRMALNTADEHLQSPNGAIFPLAERLLLSARPGHILCSESTARLLRRGLPEGWLLRDLGPLRLRGSEIPEHVFLAYLPGGPASDLLPDAVPMAADSLPIPATRFFGRADELEALTALLTSEDAPRLLTLTGAGGSGKTRLALETARRLAGEPRCLWWIPLQDHRSAADVPAAILQAMGATPGPDPMQQVVQALQREPAVLFLDNFEQLVPAGCGVVHCLLSRVPNLRCVVTSRHRLLLEGETELPVRPLAVPREEAPLVELAATASAQLFIDRARLARPDFQLTAASAGAVAELCRRLEGVPLALELVAARAQALAPSQILSRLGEHLDWKGSRAMVVSRHQSLRAALDWSCDLLPADLQRFFAMLSVFRGGWTLEAAEAVCADPDALHRLSQLRDYSLILLEEVGDEIRYRFLDTVREYAAGRLEATGEAGRVRYRHAEYLVRLAERAAPHLAGAEQGPWLARLVPEHENIRAALRWLAERPEHSSLALRLTTALRQYWVARSYWEEGQREILGAVDRAGDAPAPLLARALAAGGLLASIRNDFSTAFELLERSRKLFGEADPEGVADTLLLRGGVYLRKGELDAARSTWQEAADRFRELGRSRGLGTCLRNLGLVAERRRDYETALGCYREYLQLAESSGSQDRVADALRSLGSTLRNLGQFEEARAAWERSRALYEELRDRSGVAYALHCLALLDGKCGNPEGARRRLESALREFDAIREFWMSAHVRQDLAEVEWKQGRPSEALVHLEVALRHARELGDPRLTAEVLTSRGDLHRLAGDSAAALTAYGEALRILRRAGIQDAQLRVLVRFAALSVPSEPSRALRLLAAAQSHAIRLGVPLAEEAQHLSSALADALRQALEPHLWEAEWSSGASLTLEEAAGFTGAC